MRYRPNPNDAILHYLSTWASSGWPLTSTLIVLNKNTLALPMMPCRVISHSSFYSKENPDPSFYYQHPPPSPHHTAASEHRDRQQIGRASHHQNLRPLLACAIDIPPQCSLACRSHCLMNVVSISPNQSVGACAYGLFGQGVSPAWLLRLVRRWLNPSI